MKKSSSNGHSPFSNNIPQPYEPATFQELEQLVQEQRSFYIGLDLAKDRDKTERYTFDANDIYKPTDTY